MKKGFTLIELLVVIAIIGILSSIAIINLNSARQRAQTAQAQGSLSSLASIVVLCLDAGGELNCAADNATEADCAAGDHVPAAGASICSGAQPGVGNDWPTLQGTWQLRYALSDQAAGTFRYYASDGTLLSSQAGGPSDGFACSEGGCLRETWTDAPNQRQ